MQVIYLLIAVLFTGVSYLLPTKQAGFSKLFYFFYVPFYLILSCFCLQ